MKRLYLASSIADSAQGIADDMGCRAKGMRLAFISTAGEVEENDGDWIGNDRNGLIEAGFDVFDYTLTGKTSKEIERDLSKIDVVHVNGGNPFYVLLQSRKSGFDRWVKTAVSDVVIYIGSSAGAHLAGKHMRHLRVIDKNDYSDELGSFECLGLTDLVFVAHWGGDYAPKERLASAKELYTENDKAVLLHDYLYIKVVDDRYQIVDVRE